MKTLKQLTLAVALLILASAAPAHSEEISGNVVGGTWSGTVTNTTVVPGEGSHTQSGGPTPIYNPNTKTIVFSYSQTTVNQVIGINTALANSGSGLQISGINYSWQYYNQDWNRGSLSAGISVTNDAGQIIHNYGHILPQTVSGWTAFSASQTFNNSYSLTELANLNISFTGRDDRFWAGYYGPMVRDVDARFRYTVDPCVSNPQSSPSCPGYKTFYNISDDSHAIVPLPFGFPFYGQVFTHSIFFDNGAVSFYSPTQPQRWGGSWTAGLGVNNSTPSNFYYTIVPLSADLIANGGLHYTQSDANYLRYTWEGVSQFGRWDSRNTFSLEIRPTGYIGLQYDRIDIEGGWTSAIIGNASLGEFITFNAATGSAFSVLETIATDCGDPLVNVNCPGHAQAFFNQQCSSNTLYSPGCPGYAEAFFAQQCSLNTLYDPACPGYATAFYDYQCSLNALYHTGCSGYAQAYFDQQCALNSLYDTACPGYAQAFFDQQCAINPLYDNSCPGYADAYYVQQCTADPLYDSGCTGYDAAYLAQQCSLNTLYDNGCPGYAQAYFDQQCSLDPLYNNQCPGYATAFYNLQCSNDALYDTGCPGHAQAFFNQQCTADALYNNQCPGYAEAYALKFIVSTPSTAPAVEEPAAVVAVAEEKPVAAVAETAAPAATAKPAEPAAPVQLVAAAPAPAAVQSTTPAPAPAPAPAARTTRQALAEQRMAAAREAAAKSAQENPGAVTAEVDSAASLEQQVELQNIVLGAMGFVAGFDAYGRATLPDGVGYRPFEIYSGQQNIDTPAARGLVGRSDRIHEEMVNEQYR